MAHQTKTKWRCHLQLKYRDILRYLRHSVNLRLTRSSWNNPRSLPELERLIVSSTVRRFSCQLLWWSMNCFSLLSSENVKHLQLPAWLMWRSEWNENDLKNEKKHLMKSLHHASWFYTILADYSEWNWTTSKYQKCINYFHTVVINKHSWVTHTGDLQ